MTDSELDPADLDLEYVIPVGSIPAQHHKKMILIAENCDGYLPMGEVASLDEAREIVESYMRNADRKNDFCPEQFVVWYRNEKGGFVKLAQHDP